MASKFPIQIINRSNNPLPAYGTPFSAGMDIRAFLDKPITLQPMARGLIPTGLYFSIPEGYEVQIRGRSGLSIRDGITVLNAPGTIDSDYRGEVKVLLINLSGKPYTIQSGDRIAQMVCASFQHVVFQETDRLPDSIRGEGGFGSTGVK